MRSVIVSTAFLMSSLPALADCNYGAIRMLEWSISPADEDTNRLNTRFRLELLKPVRMIDGSAGFRDVLGEPIASFALERDRSLAPGEEFTEEGLWGPFTFERLLLTNKHDVEEFVCVRAVVYDDGTIDRF